MSEIVRGKSWDQETWFTLLHAAHVAQLSLVLAIQAGTGTRLQPVLLTDGAGAALSDGARGQVRSDCHLRTWSCLTLIMFGHSLHSGRLEYLRGRRWSWLWAQTLDTEHWSRYTCPGERTLTPLCISHYDLCECSQRYSRDPGWDWWEEGGETSVGNEMIPNQTVRLLLHNNTSVYLQTLLGFNLHFLLSGWLAS